MKFEQVTANNFMCFGENVEIPLGNQGLVFVAGENLDNKAFADSNLSGKSTFFDLILWVVFGKTFKGVRGKDVIREGTDGCIGSLIVNGKEIKREWTKADKNMLYLDNQEVTQLTIEDFLKTDWDSFTNFVLFGDSGEVNLFGNSPNKKRFEMIRPFLNFDKWDLSCKRAKDLYDELAKKKTTLELQKSDNETLLIKLESDLNETATKIESKNSELKTFEDVIGQQIRSVWIEFQQLTIDIGKLVGDNKVLNSDKSQLLTGQFAKEQILQKLREEYVRFETDSKKLEKWKVERETESKTLNGMSSMKILCQSCKYKLSQQSKSLSDFSGVDKNLQENSIKMAALTERGTAVKKDIEDLKEQVVKINSQLESNGNIIEEKGKTSETKSLTIEALKQKQANFKVEIEQELTVLKATQQDTELKVEELKYQNLNIASDLKIIERRLLNLGFLKDVGFNNAGCKNVELSLVLPHINKMIRNTVYSVFHDDYPLEISCSKLLKSGDSKAEIDLRMGNKYIMKSKSERRRIDLVIQIALAALLPTPCNIMGFDELISSLDPKGTEIVLDLLKSLIGNVVTSIFVISHNQVEYPFDNIITFRRQNGKTGVVL
uniref:RecF/RecN/SMC N-terminal domain-containing protein n=1 Tax=viral metagenome TaxID=1070528 RepID=A0A6M3IKS5_9ZZZZ